MSTDEETIIDVPVGYRLEIVLASHFKRALVTHQMTADERLKLLEGLNGMLDNYFSEAALAAIQPAGDIDAEIISEAMRLNGQNPPRSEGFDLLASNEVFATLLRLNPSLMRAMRIMNRARAESPWRSPAADQSAVAAAAAPSSMNGYGPPTFWPSDRRQPRVSNKEIDLFTGQAID